MKKLMAAMAMLAVIASGTAAAAGGISATTNMGPGGKRIGIGAYLSMGMAHQVGDDDAPGYDDPEPRFAGGAGGYFDYYFTRIFALEAGLGFFGKGARFDGNNDPRLKILAMELVVGPKLNIHGFRATFLFSTTFNLKNKFKYDDSSYSSDDFWDYYHRVNIGTRIVLGYAIPAGPVSIIPNVSWYIDFINDVDNDEFEDDFGGDPDYSSRAMNFMFRIAVEIGI